MKWDKEAEKAISRVPFFIRKRVRTKVEEKAKSMGSDIVRLMHIKMAQMEYLKKMDKEIKGYEIETCFGPSGCPNSIIEQGDLIERLETLLEQKDIKGFLLSSVEGKLKMHHQFRISISDCPNACSRPQIVDIGLIGATRVEKSGNECIHCMRCIEACRESAIEMHEDGPVINHKLCLMCGACIRACEEGHLISGKSGYRILIGGKLGRHPMLGYDLGEIFSKDEAIQVVDHIIDYYMDNSRKGERLGSIIQREGINNLIKKLKN